MANPFAFTDTSPPLAGAGLQLAAADNAALRALAAYQLRYGFPDEAVVLLMIARRFWPRDPGVLGLLAQALLQARHDHTAEIVLAEYEQYEAHRAGAVSSLLLRAILLLRRLKFGEARRVFLQCLGRRRNGAS